MSMKSKTDIPPLVRAKIYERDSIDDAPCCIFCGSPRDIEIMHYVSRARGGMGIEQNLACGCHSCHAKLDNGSNTVERETLKDMFKFYLETQYPNWKEEDLITRKG